MRTGPRRISMLGMMCLLLVLGCKPQKPIAVEKSETPAVTPPPRGDGTAQVSAEDVKLRVVTKAEYDGVIAGHKGKVVLVDFWATYCVPCRKQFPHTVELSRTLAEQGLAVVSVSCDGADKHDAALQFLQKAGARFDNLRARDGGEESTFTDFDIDGGAVPHYKLYDRTGKLRHKFGQSDPTEPSYTSEDIDAKVRELLAEK